MNRGFVERLSGEIEGFRREGVTKRFNTLESPQAARVRMEGRGEIIVLSSNNQPPQMRRIMSELAILTDSTGSSQFRAGRERRRRLALTLLDDATRFGLAVLVGTSETTELFLHALHRALLRFGLMTAFFLDRGPGFRSDDTVAVLAKLGIHLILLRNFPPTTAGRTAFLPALMPVQLLSPLDLPVH